MEYDQSDHFSRGLVRFSKISGCDIAPCNRDRVMIYALVTSADGCMDRLNADVTSIKRIPYRTI
jgi:hypothetical protein